MAARPWGFESPPAHSYNRPVKAGKGVCMLEDFQRTLVKAFGWVFTVLPIGLRFFSIALLISVSFCCWGSVY